jgi:site-specific DNA-methyltransferase (adenine-specific)
MTGAKMSPTNAGSNYELYHGECLEVMKDLPSNSVNLILADLPYATTDRHGSEKKNNGKSRIFDWDSVIPLEPMWEEYKRLLKPLGAVVLTADQPFTSQLVLSNLDWFKYEWIWKKARTTGFLTANFRPMKQTEDILVFSEGGAAAASQKSGRNMVYNPQGLISKIVNKKNNPKRLGKVLGQESFIGKNNKSLSDAPYQQKWTNYPTEILEFSQDKNSFHPTQKPVALMEYLIRTYSNEGDMILDNVMGSGSTGIAALNSGRKFIGIEMADEYYEYAAKWIESQANSLSDN